jgi:hypothetical protein
MSSDTKIWFSAKEISLLGERRVAGLPKTESGSRRHISQERWVSREVKGGGGPGGILTEYQPPADILALIHPFLQANPDFFAKSKTRTRVDLAALSKQVFGDAPLRIAQNPNPEYDAALRRVYEATQATVRVSKLFGGSLPVEWTTLIQELMAMHGLSEAGAARVIETLKQRT